MIIDWQANSWSVIGRTIFVFGAEFTLGGARLAGTVRVGLALDGLVGVRPDLDEQAVGKKALEGFVQ